MRIAKKGRAANGETTEFMWTSDEVSDKPRAAEEP